MPSWDSLISQPEVSHIRLHNRKNAKVAFSSEKKYLVIEKEYLGNTLNHDELITAIGKALKSGHEKVNLTDEKKYPDVYEKPSIYSTDPSLQQKVDACNPVILQLDTWTIQNDIKKPSVQNRFIMVQYKNEKLLLIIRQLEKGLKKPALSTKLLA